MEVFMDINKLEQKDDLNVENIFEDISEEDLHSRIQLVTKQMTIMSDHLRAEVPVLPDNELLENEKFRKWLICNLVIEQALKDDPSFNRLLYFLYTKCERNIVELLDQYDLIIHKDDNGNLTGFNVMVVENEFE